MEKITSQFTSLMKRTGIIRDALKKLGTTPHVDWFAIFCVIIVICVIGSIFAVYEYRMAVSKYTNFIPNQTASSTRNFDITKAQQAFDIFAQKEIITQDIMRGKQDIGEMPR